MYVPGPPAVQVPAPLVENEDIASPSLLTGVLVAMGTLGSAASCLPVELVSVHCPSPGYWEVCSLLSPPRAADSKGDDRNSSLLFE